MYPLAPMAPNGPNFFLKLSYTIYMYMHQYFHEPNM